jgi:hypothetical protein
VTVIVIVIVISRLCFPCFDNLIRRESEEGVTGVRDMRGKCRHRG